MAELGQRDGEFKGQEDSGAAAIAPQPFVGRVERSETRRKEDFDRIVGSPREGT
jgi:hypothetical protein